MTDVRLNEIPEVASGFVTELRTGGTPLRLLRDAVKDTITCDYTNVPQLLVSAPLRAASEPVREQPPPSTYRKRAYANFTFNPETLAFDLASQSLVGVRSTNNLPSRSKRLKLYSPNGIFDTMITAGSDDWITVNQTGMYRLEVNLNLGFFATGMEEAASFSTWKGVGQGSISQTQVQIYVVVRTGSTSRYILLREDFLLRSDLELNRSRFLAGHADVQLTQGSTFGFYFSRGPSLGVMQKTGQTDRLESIGLKKLRYVYPGANPVRDALNYAEVYRLA